MNGHLDATGQQERLGVLDFSNEEAVHHAAHKDKWHSIYTGQARRHIDVIVELLRTGDQDCVLCSIGSGAGFELKLLLER